MSSQRFAEVSVHPLLVPIAIGGLIVALLVHTLAVGIGGGPTKALIGFFTMLGGILGVLMALAGWIGTRGEE